MTSMSTFKAVFSDSPVRLFPPLVQNYKDPRGYRPVAGLAEAMDVAMMLGQALLLTGEPGTGKSQAARWLASALKVPFLRFDVKSTSSGTSLLYHFDEVARFRDATNRSAEKFPLQKYIRFNALGEGILRAYGSKLILKTTGGTPLEGNALTAHAALLREAFGIQFEPQENAARVGHLLANNPAAQSMNSSYVESEPECTVVLIDELDKAPRDTPNDLLAEFDEMRVTIPELGLVIESDDPSAVRPVVVITSNSERALPEPFLRRCVFFNLPFPESRVSRANADPETDNSLEGICEARVTRLKGGGLLLQQIIDLFRKLREAGNGIQKRPGTAELLSWLDILVNRYRLDPKSDLKRSGDGETALKETLGVVLKAKEDLDVGASIVDNWLGKSK